MVLCAVARLRRGGTAGLGLPALMARNAPIRACSTILRRHNQRFGRRLPF
jgi:hypothetical protein